MLNQNTLPKILETKIKTYRPSKAFTAVSVAIAFTYKIEHYIAPSIPFPHLTSN